MGTRGRHGEREVVPPVDLDAPEWVPIHGVSLDRYIELAALVEGVPADDRDATLEREGVGRGTWTAVDRGWRSRMAAQPAVAERHDRLAGLTRPGRTPPPARPDR